MSYRTCAYRKFEIRAARLRRNSPAPCKGKVFGSNPKSIELLDTHLAMF